MTGWAVLGMVESGDNQSAVVVMVRKAPPLIEKVPRGTAVGA